jgi:hypothetical protein
LPLSGEGDARDHSRSVTHAFHLYPEVRMHTTQVRSGGRYPVLRSLAILYLIGSAVAVLGGLIAAGWALVRAPYAPGDRVILAVGALAAAFFVVISMLAIAEVLKLFIDMEHNTRVTAMLMRPATPPAPPASVEPGMTGVPGVTGERQYTNRLDALDDETAEAALLRGH